jgi:fructokinase
MLNVTGLGEILIDFTPVGKTDTGKILYEPNSGGAIPNVLIAAKRFGGECGFMGMVGNDQFGRQLNNELLINDIDTRGLKITDGANTTLAFVHLNENGDRSFSFVRKAGADTHLTVNDLALDVIDESKIFHFGSLSFTDEPSRSATIEAIKYAKQKEKFISYDPNWRPLLWRNKETAKAMMIIGLQFADIVKVSEEELELLTGETDLKKGAQKLADYDISVVLITLGSKGCYFKIKNGENFCRSYKVNVVDTTGCGDAFMGTMLCQLSKYDNLSSITTEALEQMVNYASAAGALCATLRGGIPAMQTRDKIEDFLKSNS